MNIVKGGQGHDEDDVIIQGKGCALLLVWSACIITITIVIYVAIRLIP